ncbi:cholesterol esterase [Thecaphora frezii]
MPANYFDYGRHRHGPGYSSDSANEDPFRDGGVPHRPSRHGVALNDPGPVSTDDDVTEQIETLTDDPGLQGHFERTDATRPRHNTRRPPHVERIGTQPNDGAREYAHEEPAFFDPTFPDYRDEAPLQMPFFDHVVADYGHYGFINKVHLNFRQLISFGISTLGVSIVLVAAYVAYLNPFRKSPPRAKADREYERRITGERGSGRPAYYAEFWGYNCDEHDIITEGGWILKAHRISDPRRPGAPGHPVVLQHGILCNSSHFVMNEERSMAFWLVDQGFDVWLTNIRSNFKAGHTEYKRNDPRFWAWGLKELAFDLKDLVDYITAATGRPQLAYVGHSQGSGSMYLALSPGICPEIGDKLSCFVALGPSVYAGSVLRRFPFSLLRQFRSRRWWGLVFGVREFIPAISIAQEFLPTWWFGHIAYVIFAYLFGFHDHNWLARQKPKIFRSVPVPTSSELLYWYMSGFSHRGCIFDPRITQPWFGRRFPPHSVFYGDIDYLVLGKPLVQRIQKYEKNLDVVHMVELQNYEHLDMIFGIDAYRTVFPGIQDTILQSIDVEQEMAPSMSELDNRFGHI